jgi:hypothetical protein
MKSVYDDLGTLPWSASEDVSIVSFSSSPPQVNLDPSDL